MIRHRILASAALLAGAFGACSPAMAQQVTQIAVLDGDAVADYRAAGAVSAELPLGASGAALPKRQLDDMLRAEAARLGADAVILVTYQITSPATPTAMHRASGVAIRYARTQAAVSPQPPVAAPLAPALPRLRRHRRRSQPSYRLQQLSPRLRRLLRLRMRRRRISLCSPKAILPAGALFVSGR